jgi:hypothetical protein
MLKLSKPQVVFKLRLGPQTVDDGDSKEVDGGKPLPK